MCTKHIQHNKYAINKQECANLFNGAGEGGLVGCVNCVG